MTVNALVYVSKLFKLFRELKSVDEKQLGEEKWLLSCSSGMALFAIQSAIFATYLVTNPRVCCL
jgi:hypothetical protein